MAIESKRGCGYRKINNLYLVTDAIAAPCDRLPFELGICPCCGGGIKFSRGFTWVTPAELFKGDHPDPDNHVHVPPDKREAMGVKENDCTCNSFCPACYPVNVFGPEGQAGLLWVGRKHYTPEDFSKECALMGMSKRINTIPHDFKLGETWIFLAHKDAIDVRPNGENDVPVQDKLFDREPSEKKRPGIFMAVKPKRIERIVKQSDFDKWADYDNERNTLITMHGMEAKDENGRLVWEVHFEKWKAGLYKPAVETMEKLDRDVSRGITLVPVPDDDKDHAK